MNKEISLNSYVKQATKGVVTKVSFCMAILVFMTIALLTQFSVSDKLNEIIRYDEDHISYLLEISDIVELKRKLSSSFRKTSFVRSAHLSNEKQERLTSIANPNVDKSLSVKLDKEFILKTNAGKYKLKVFYYVSFLPWLISIFCGLLVLLFFRKMMSKFMLGYTKKIEKNFDLIHESLKAKDLSFDAKTDILEVNEITKRIAYLKENESKLLKSKSILAKEELARKISHDLESKVLALRNILIHFTKKEKDNYLITNEYYNDLLKNLDVCNAIISNIKRDNINKHTTEKVDEVFVPYFLESVINSKKIEAKEKNVSISLKKDSSLFDAFVSFNLSELDIILSNILNNSIDSFDQVSNFPKTIKVNAIIANNKVEITICDNGIGIDEESLKKIFENSFTTKDEGTGRGLYYAKKEIESNGGLIDIISDGKNKGTKCKIELPLSSKSNWHKREFDLNHYSNVTILDDEGEYFSTLEEMIRGVSIKTFKDSSEITDFSKETFFIVDYDLNEKMNGLDFIIKHNLEDRSLLLTNRGDEISLLKKCSRLNVKIWHKKNINELKFKKQIEKTTKSFVYIDDEELFLKIARKEAIKKNVNLLTFSQPSEFMDKIDSFEIGTYFYIDQNLKADLSGDDLAKELTSRGHKFIYSFTFDTPDLSKKFYHKTLDKKSLLGSEKMFDEMSL